MKAIGNPRVMKLRRPSTGCTTPGLMGFTLKLMANLTDPRGGDVADRLINGLSTPGTDRMNAPRRGGPRMHRNVCTTQETEAGADEGVRARSWV